jgi:S-(hydroxymethyl)glutathione dehydrogenase/alcohol dehydrogenase
MGDARINEVRAHIARLARSDVYEVDGPRAPAKQALRQGGCGPATSIGRLMKAAVFRAAGAPLSIEEVQLDRPGPREVVVRTMAAGLCHSDLSVMNGHVQDQVQPPAVLGHESAGIIEAVGSQVTYVMPGDHVVTCVSQFCGMCEFCLSGRPYLCLGQGIVRGSDEGPRITQGGQPVGQFEGISAFAEQLLVHENAVVKIGDDIPFDHAALMGCCITTGLGAAINTALVRPGTTCAVIGCGGVGLAVIQGCFIAGASKIIAVDRVSARLRRARSLGATDVVDASSSDSVEGVKQLSGGGVDYAFEVVGSKLTAEQAFQMTRAGGVAVIVGGTNEEMRVNVWELLFDRVLRGCMLGSNRFRIDIPRWLDLYRQGRLQLDEFITARIALEGINAGYAAMERGEGVRSIIMFEESGSS